MDYMFAQCEKLTSVIVGYKWDDSKATKNNWFYGAGVGGVIKG